MTRLLHLQHILSSSSSPFDLSCSQTRKPLKNQRIRWRNLRHNSALYSLTNHFCNKTWQKMPLSLEFIFFFMRPRITQIIERSSFNQTAYSHLSLIPFTEHKSRLSFQKWCSKTKFWGEMIFSKSFVVKTRLRIFVFLSFVQGLESFGSK